MNITSLIAELEKLRAVHGEMEVACCDDERNLYYRVMDPIVITMNTRTGDIYEYTYDWDLSPGDKFVMLDKGWV